MVKFGYKLMTEEHGPRELVRNAKLAEQAGFDFVSISDHFHPWLEAQGHSPFAWSVLGAIAQETEKVGIITGVTCPIIRYHPAIIAQAAATIAVLSEDRFTLGIGAGERLNEHVTGATWPNVFERHAMLSEAIDIFRALWDGEVHTINGAHFTLDHARLYDPPNKPIAILLAVSGEHSVALAAAKADGVMTTEPKAELVSKFRAKKHCSAYAEVTLAYAASEAAALKLAHERFKLSAFDWSVNSELPNPAGFEAAAKFVRPDDIKGSVSLGPDVEKHVAHVKKYLDAGFDHIVLLGVGPNQEEFTRFFADELKPALQVIAQ